MLAMRVVAKATRAPIDRCRTSMEPGWDRDRTSIITIVIARWRTRARDRTGRDRTARHGTGCRSRRHAHRDVKRVRVVTHNVERVFARAASSRVDVRARGDGGAGTAPRRRGAVVGGAARRRS
jgi:hypothetical protein